MFPEPISLFGKYSYSPIHPILTRIHQSLSLPSSLNFLQICC